MMDQLKHSINRGGLKRGELNVIAMPIVMSSVRTTPLTKNKELQLTLESDHVKQNCPNHKQV